MRLAAELCRVQMQMKPFGHARAVRSEADNLILALELDGVTGVGECVPRDYVTGETVESAFDAIRALDLAGLVDRVARPSFTDSVAALEAVRLPSLLQQRARLGLAAACAVELALLDVLAKRASVSLDRTADALGLPADMRRRIDPPQPIRASRALDSLGNVESLKNGPYLPDHVKVKGGKDPGIDLERARVVRDVFGDRVTLSIDANMSWSLDDAIRRVEILQPLGVLWFEEPLAQHAWQDYRRLRERTGMKVMLDESLCSYEDARRAIDSGACDMFNIRVSKHGGLIGSLRIAELAHQNGVGIQLGVHIGQMGILGAAGAHFLHSVGNVATMESSCSWIGSGGFPESIIREQLNFDHTIGVCAGLAPTGLGVTLASDVLDRHAVTRSTWGDGR